MLGEALLIVRVMELPLEDTYKLGVLARAVAANPSKDSEKIKTESLVKRFFIFFVSRPPKFCLIYLTKLYF